MSEKYKKHNPEGMCFLTMTIMHLIDLFTRPELSDVIVAAIKHCQKRKRASCLFIRYYVKSCLFNNI
jgi:hypothetical protein